MWAMVGQFISTLLFALGIAIILKLHGNYGITTGIYVGLLITLFFHTIIRESFFTGKKSLFLLDVCERQLVLWL